MYFSFSVEFGLGQWVKRASISTTRADTTTARSWKRLRDLVKNRDGLICQHCGEFAPDGHVDHMVALFNGGTDAIDNLVWACALCNQSKGIKDNGDWDKPEENPPPQTIRIEIQASEETSLWDVNTRQVLLLARAALQGQLGIYSDHGLSRRRFAMLRDEAVRRGLLRWKVHGARTQGVELTPQGKQVFTRLLSEHGKDVIVKVQ